MSELTALKAGWDVSISFLAAEYGVGDFYRVFQIHESIDSSRIEAECKNGVLTVHLPKAETAKPKQVKIKA